MPFSTAGSPARNLANRGGARGKERRPAVGSTRGGGVARTGRALAFPADPEVGAGASATAEIRRHVLLDHTFEVRDALLEGEVGAYDLGGLPGSFGDPRVLEQ